MAVSLTGFNAGNQSQLTVLPCKAKRQYLLTCKVSRYCLLALHDRVLRLSICNSSSNSLLDQSHYKVLIRLQYKYTYIAGCYVLWRRHQSNAKVFLKMKAWCRYIANFLKIHLLLVVTSCINLSILGRTK